MTDRELIEVAKEAMERAYAPYSNFKVGAALITDDGTVFSGSNIENISYGATNCAERTAIFKMVDAGYRSFERIAIVSSKGDVTYPCGICRQVISEFAMDSTVIFEDKDGQLIKIPMTQVLPYHFEHDDLRQ